MNFEKLIGYPRPEPAAEADVVEERGRAFGKIAEELVDFQAQAGQVIGPRMQVGELLAQLAPELLGRVAPGGVGRQGHDLEGQLELAPLLERRRTGGGGPIARSIERKRAALRKATSRSGWV